MLYLFSKRLFDILFSIIVLIVISPLFLPLIIALRLTGEGYIWYLQERVGYKNKLFNIIKFATMLKNSPNMDGGLITLKKDPRLMPLGGFLRSTKINELPQIINILKGEMSVVGPRPVMKKSFDTYPEEIQKIIFNVKPGLTGIGSIIFHDEEALLTRIKHTGSDTWDFYRNTLYPFKGKVEKWYQQNAGLLTDIKIIIITAWVIFFPNNRIVYKWFPTLPKREF
jgi:lipopolysaccharide/colanic/teichoic acid biosynthesis glycosyltransferase